MPITYPTALPSTPGFKRFKMSSRSVVGMSTSIFNLQQQVQEWPGEMWMAQGSLPDMARAAAEEWIAFRLALRGSSGTFLLGDPSARTPRGAATLASWTTYPVTSGILSAQVKAIDTYGWGNTVTNVLRKGDYLQVNRNHLVAARAMDNAAWVVNQNTKGGANGQTAPDGTATAERITPTGGATNAYIYQQAATTGIAGQTFTFKVWLKAAAGTPSIEISVRNQALASMASAVCALTTSWQPFTVTGTLGSSDTGAVGLVGGNNSWVVAEGAVDVWGAGLYSDYYATLHKVLLDYNSDGSGNATFDIYPRTRVQLEDFSQLITSSAKGNFRLASNQTEWDVDEVQHFGLDLSAIEAV